jgi:hypothetical protein
VEWNDISVLVTVKAYPSIAADVGEAVCVAGIREDTGDWIRLYPLPFRDLPRDKQFDKYATISVAARKAPKDSRPESYVARVDTLEVVKAALPAGTWVKRRAVIDPLERPSMCAIIREQEETHRSLGLFRPAEPPELVVQRHKDEGWAPEKQAVIDQARMLGPDLPPLERIPYRFLYRYRCAGEPGCRGHEQTIIDWEIVQAFRREREAMGEKAAVDWVLTRWTDDLWAPGRDSRIFTGNQAAHRASFMVLGVFWPPKASTAASEVTNDQLGFEF